MLVNQITQHLDQTTSTYYATSFAQKLNRTCLFHFFVTYRCVHHIMEVMSIFQASFKEIIHSCSVSLVSGSLIPPGAVVFDASRAVVCASAATNCFTAFLGDILEVFVGT